MGGAESIQYRIVTYQQVTAVQSQYLTLSVNTVRRLYHRFYTCSESWHDIKKAIQPNFQVLHPFVGLFVHPHYHVCSIK